MKRISSYMATTAPRFVFLLTMICCSSDKEGVIPPAMIGILIDSQTKEIVSEEAIDEGHIKIPNDKELVLLSLLEDTIIVEGNAYFNDSSHVQYRLSLNYKLNKSRATELYSDFGKDYRELFVEPEIRRVVREVLHEISIPPPDDIQDLVLNRTSTSFTNNSLEISRILFFETYWNNK